MVLKFSTKKDTRSFTDILRVAGRERKGADSFPDTRVAGHKITKEGSFQDTSCGLRRAFIATRRSRTVDGLSPYAAILPIKTKAARKINLCVDHCYHHTEPQLSATAQAS